ncbi:GSTP1-like protein [Mya arenaria]|uniref:glutathione transferase n=1 Tax=Mya arenaria TaxID=6604 RepID=A0ABY7EDY2_MYAAR|nr:glutathione S-transferase P-like isoform X1 [Mya arenaria]XP_052808499.1 glutathione S-transferase P-like isoform X2 [Mya arenaria]WAR06946.1 GSTP1-like protein [Mya arenaria]
MPIQLYYFQLRGRAQAIRYLLIDNGLEYEEINVGPEWATKWKAETPFGQCPMIKDGDLKLAQSCAILRYFGRKAGIDPSDLVSAARVDMINDHEEDIRNAYVKLIYQNYDAGKADFVKDAAAKVKFLEDLFKAGGNEFILSKISWADYNLFDLLDILCILSPGFLDQSPSLKAYYDRIAARPAIKAFRESDRNMKAVNGNGKQ